MFVIAERRHVLVARPPWGVSSSAVTAPEGHSRGSRSPTTLFLPMSATKPPAEVGETVNVDACLSRRHFGKCNHRAGDQQFPASLVVRRLSETSHVGVHKVSFNLEKPRVVFQLKTK